MKPRCVYTVVLGVALTMPLSGPLARAQQDADAPAPRPPEIERLMELAKDPDRLRQVMSDPEQVREVMRLMESDAVREFVRDPQHVRELMSEINPEQIRQAVQAVDPSVVRQAVAARWMERLRRQLGATDEEWKALGPKVEKLLRAQQEVRAGIRGVGRGGFAGGFGGGGFGNLPGGNAGEPSEVEDAAAALREAAEDPDVSSRETSRRLLAYRKAREKARQRLEQAEREVKELLTSRQEGILLVLGLVN